MVYGFIQQKKIKLHLEQSVAKWNTEFKDSVAIAYDDMNISGYPFIFRISVDNVLIKTQTGNKERSSIPNVTMDIGVLGDKISATLSEEMITLDQAGNSIKVAKSSQKPRLDVVFNQKNPFGLYKTDYKQLFASIHTVDYVTGSMEEYDTRNNALLSSVAGMSMSTENVLVDKDTRRMNVKIDLDDFVLTDEGVEFFTKMLSGSEVPDDIVKTYNKFVSYATSLLTKLRHLTIKTDITVDVPLSEGVVVPNGAHSIDIKEFLFDIKRYKVALAGKYERNLSDPLPFGKMDIMLVNADSLVDEVFMGLNVIAKEMQGQNLPAANLPASISSFEGELIDQSKQLLHQIAQQGTEENSLHIKVARDTGGMFMINNRTIPEIVMIYQQVFNTAGTNH